MNIAVSYYFNLLPRFSFKEKPAEMKSKEAHPEIVNLITRTSLSWAGRHEYPDYLRFDVRQFHRMLYYASRSSEFYRSLKSGDTGRIRPRSWEFNMVVVDNSKEVKE